MNRVICTSRIVSGKSQKSVQNIGVLSNTLGDPGRLGDRNLQLQQSGCYSTFGIEIDAGLISDSDEKT